MSKTALVSAALVLAGTSFVLAQRVDVSRTDTPEVVLKTAVNLELVDGQPNAAVQRYREIATRFKATNRRVAAQALLHAARSYEKIASSEARVVYAELLRDFADQPEAAEARTRLGAVRGARSQVDVSPRRVIDGSTVEMLGGRRRRTPGSGKGNRRTQLHQPRRARSPVGANGDGPEGHSLGVLVPPAPLEGRPSSSLTVGWTSQVAASRKCRCESSALRLT